MSKEVFTQIPAWHQNLLENKGRCATLKRCKTLAEIYLHPNYVELCQILNKSCEGTALIAGVLAHVKKTNDLDKDSDISHISFAKKMAYAKGGSDTPIISHIRFQRLLATKKRDQLLRILIRITKQVNNFNTINFSIDLFYWNNRVRKQWAYDYYSTLKLKS